MTEETPMQPKDETQAIVEAVDEHLKQALKYGNTYSNHDEMRPTAIMAFDEVDKARKVLDKIDEREFNNHD